MATKLDDVDWHLDDATTRYPELGGADEDAAARACAHAGAHIALFLRWGLGRGMGPRVAAYEAADPAGRVASGEMSGTDFMETIADWKLYDDVFADEIRAFSEAYYGLSGLYPWDVGRAVTGDYSWCEADCDFAGFSGLVDRRLEAFRRDGRKAVTKPGFLARLFGAKGPAPADWRPSP